MDNERPNETMNRPSANQPGAGRSSAVEAAAVEAAAVGSAAVGSAAVRGDGSGQLAKTDRSRVRRQPVRASYDRKTAYGILDAGLVAQVAFCVDGRPFVIPMVYGRSGDLLYLHGAAVSRILKTLAGGVEISLGVTHVDGLVLARSAFHHSVNYRSVVFFGTAFEVTDHQEKLVALDAVVEHVVPGRSPHVRGPSEKEVAITKVLALRLDEGSVKCRVGPPVDDEEDYKLPVWAGVVPLAATPGTPLVDDRVAPGIEIPSCVTEYKRPGQDDVDQDGPVGGLGVT